MSGSEQRGRRVRPPAVVLAALLVLAGAVTLGVALHAQHSPRAPPPAPRHRRQPPPLPPRRRPPRCRVRRAPHPAPRPPRRRGCCCPPLPRPIWRCRRSASPPTCSTWG